MLLLIGMKNSQQIAQIGAAFGPFLLAVISGSGNAAALAFNGAVTPHAADFGYGIMELGSMAQIGAGIGRSMSPVAGAGISSLVLQESILWKWQNAMLYHVSLLQL